MGKMRSCLYLTMALSVLSQLQSTYALAPASARALLAAPASAAGGNAIVKDTLFEDGLGKDLNLAYLMPAQAFTITSVLDSNTCFGAEYCPGGSWSEQANVTYGDKTQFMSASAKTPHSRRNLWSRSFHP